MSNNHSQQLTPPTTISIYPCLYLSAMYRSTTICLASTLVFTLFHLSCSYSCGLLIRVKPLTLLFGWSSFATLTCRYRASRVRSSLCSGPPLAFPAGTMARIAYAYLHCPSSSSYLLVGKPSLSRFVRGAYPSHNPPRRATWPKIKTLTFA